tara:strand:+ start:1321 stop:1719 length:399 start_codon:yes stop_codon:yes gene_type:complete
MKVFDKKGELLAHIYHIKNNEVKQHTFFSENSDMLQYGIIKLDESGKKHKHLEIKRPSIYHRTQEVLFLYKGYCDIFIGDDEGEEIKILTLKPYTIIRFFSGSHNLIDTGGDAQLLEVKNGPYYGEKDKIWL